MPDKKGNLYLYEAIELRKEYARHVELLEGLLGGHLGSISSLIKDMSSFLNISSFCDRCHRLKTQIQLC